MKLKKGITFLAFFLSASYICAQETTRPKIGLTLSGGGAKGLAHIGILQAIDSAGLKVDYITGTSMGSIVGAMYAAGYSGDSIEKIARVLDWDLLFSTAPTLSAISIEEKSEYDKYALVVPMQNGKLKITKGVIEGQELWLKLSEIFEPVYNINNFSDLSIPFKCIGTDLETGNAVQMDHGNIVTAVRASMAIPAVFTPVKYDSMLLIDGGVVNNFPVTDVKQMGADYVIGVNLNQGLVKANEINSALDILLQIGFFKDAATFEKNKALCDIYILPELKGYSTGSFSASDSIIDIGIQTGNLYYPYFKKLADSLNTLYGQNGFVKDRLPESKMNISKYTVSGLNHTTPQFFSGLLDLKDNKNYTHIEMSNAIRRVYGSRYYKIIRYDFLPAPNGSTEMHFNVEENPLTAVKLALNYNDFTSLSLIFNLTSRDLLFKESRALVSVALSQNPRLYAEYYKFINKKRTARAVLDYYYEASDYPIYNDFRLYETLRSVYRRYDFQLQKNLNLNSYVGIGQQYIKSKIKTEETPPFIYNGQNTNLYTYASYVLNNVSQKYFPTQGWIVKAEAGFVYNQDPEYEYSYNDSTVIFDSINSQYGNYFKIFINASHFTKLSSKLSWNQNFTLGYLMTNNPYIADEFSVGGMYDVLHNQVQFAGLNVSEVKTGSIASMKFGLQYKIGSKTFISGCFNAALYDFYNVDAKSINAANNFLTGYGLSFGYNSPIGPLQLTVMYCDQDSKVRSNINLGFNF